MSGGPGGSVSAALSTSVPDVILMSLLVTTRLGACYLQLLLLATGYSPAVFESGEILRLLLDGDAGVTG